MTTSRSWPKGRKPINRDLKKKKKKKKVIASTGDLLQYPIRIIDTHALKLETDTSLYAGCYAILSHTWLQEPAKEVVFAEVEDIFAKFRERWQWPPATFKAFIENCLYGPAPVTGNLEKSKKSAESKNGGSTMQIESCQPAGPGVVKLLRAVDRARRMGYRYLWVDSCCNNQSDQKELQKALVSMAQWYANARVCFVFLEECPLNRNALALHNLFKSPESLSNFMDGFRKYIQHERWCTRGWTVQEIIMCKRVIFLNRKWEPITKYPHFMLESVHGPALHGFFIHNFANVPLDLICVGQRPGVSATRILSLAIFRQTTRPEDRAYSLMGILGVQMEVRYGEGLPSALDRLCNSITGPERKSVLNWLDRVKREDEPERREVDFLLVGKVQVAGLDMVDLRRGLLALEKHEQELRTVGATYQFECSLNGIQGFPISKSIQIPAIVTCPLADIQDLAGGRFWGIAKLSHTKGDLEDFFLCVPIIERRAQIKSPSSDWIRGNFIRRLYMVNSFSEYGDVIRDFPELFSKAKIRKTFILEEGFSDQHAGLEKGKNITQDLRRYSQTGAPADTILILLTAFASFYPPLLSMFVVLLLLTYFYRAWFLASVVVDVHSAWLQTV